MVFVTVVTHEEVELSIVLFLGCQPAVHIDCRAAAQSIESVQIGPAQQKAKSYIPHGAQHALPDHGGAAGLEGQTGCKYRCDIAWAVILSLINASNVAKVTYPRVAVAAFVTSSVASSSADTAARTRHLFQCLSVSGQVKTTHLG